jgi:CheY-like chemotaxis protein
MDWTAPRILVIAPAPALCFTIEEVLRAYGYDVTAAASSAAALQLDAEGPFAALLLDPALLAASARGQRPPVRLEADVVQERWPVEEELPV